MFSRRLTSGTYFDCKLKLCSSLEICQHLMKKHTSESVCSHGESSLFLYMICVLHVVSRGAPYVRLWSVYGSCESAAPKELCPIVCFSECVCILSTYSGCKHF